jgi:hypothetical protein
MAILPDSGYRKEFISGAVRDTPDGKGRCDLVPLLGVASLLGDEKVDFSFLAQIECYQRTGKDAHLEAAMNAVIKKCYDGCIPTAMLEVARHYEDGAKKYSDRNWEKGIPAHCYVDSAVRHYLKWLRGDSDEPHARAVLWNLLSLEFTMIVRPEMNDLPYTLKEAE